MLSAICNFPKADLKEKHTCVKLCFKLRESASEMQEKKPELLLQPRNKRAALPVQKSLVTTPTQNKANQVVYQEYVDLFGSVTALFIGNLFLQAKQLTRITTRFCNI
jgi:hypothetical protein